MGAIFGIAGGGSEAELRSMSDRLVHRGGRHHTWSPHPGVLLGLRWSDGLPRVPSGGPTAGAASAPPEPGDLPVAFDGLIDNAGEVRRELELDGVGGPESDAALLLQAYRRRGPEGLELLSGQFCAAIADPDGRLALARDRCGLRRLYFAVVGDRLLFASEIKALLGVGDVPARPDPDTIQYIVRRKFETPFATALRDVRPVRPGTVQAFSDGAVGPPRRYWDVRLDVRSRDLAAQAARLRGALVDVLRRQSDRFPTIGIALSGGFDSAVTLGALSAAVPGREIHSFCSGYGPEDPEIKGARDAARHFGTSHREVIVRPADVPALLPEAVWRLEEPIGREDVPTMHALAGEAAATGVDAVWTGFEADGLFGGMPRHLLVYWSGRLPPLRAPFRDLLRYGQHGAAPTSLRGRALQALHYRGADHPPPSVLGAGPVEVPDPLPPPGPEYLNRHLRAGVLEVSHGFQEALHQGHGVAMLTPFASRDLIRLAFRISEHDKIRGRRQKHVLRVAGEAWLPPALRGRPKSFNKPAIDLEYSRMLDGLAEGLLARSAVRDRGLFDPSYVEGVRRRAMGRPYPAQQSLRLWSLIVTELWARAFLDRRGASPPRLE